MIMFRNKESPFTIEHKLDLMAIKDASAIKLASLSTNPNAPDDNTSENHEKDPDDWWQNGGEPPTF
jgi:hypothetical protein